MKVAVDSHVRSRFPSLRAAATLGGLACLIFAAHAFSLGLKHVSTASAYRMATEAWARNEYAHAAELFSLAVGMTWRGGFQSEIAAVHLARLRRLQNAGDLEGALRECASAVRALGMYDDEGATSCMCFQIENDLARTSGG